MTIDDNRPSIAELQEISRRLRYVEMSAGTTQLAAALLVDVAPVLLEIAAATMARDLALSAIIEDRSKDWGPVYAADAAVKRALAKVRP